jgi:hypothetical protein
MSDCNSNTQSCDTSKGACDTKSSCETPKAKSEGGCTLAEDLLCLAKSAKHELLKDKMKVRIEAKLGKKLDKLADAAVEAMIGCYEHQMAGKQACDKYKDAIQSALKG